MVEATSNAPPAAGTARFLVQCPDRPGIVAAVSSFLFARRANIYAAFLDMEGPTFVSLRGQGGEEVVIGVRETEGGTAVTPIDVV